MNGLRALLLSMMLLTLAGCGFHLRGATVLPEPMVRTELHGAAPEGPLGIEIAQVLRNAGGALLAPGEGGTSALHILGERTDRRVASLSSTGKASEYELRYVLTAVLRGPDGEELVPEQSVSVVRTYAYDSANVLGSSNEEELLKREMRRQSVRQLLRQINRVLDTSQSQ